MRAQKRGCYTLKTYQSELYTWCPDPGLSKKIPHFQTKKRLYFCSASPGSQGEDWVTTYVYNEVIDAGLKKRLAYVACDYVQ